MAQTCSKPDKIAHCKNMSYFSRKKSAHKHFGLIFSDEIAHAICTFPKGTSPRSRSKKIPDEDSKKRELEAEKL